MSRNDPVNFVDPSGLDKTDFQTAKWNLGNDEWFMNMGFSAQYSQPLAYYGLNGPPRTVIRFAITYVSDKNPYTDYIYWIINWGFPQNQRAGFVKSDNKKDPNSPECQALARKIENIQKEIRKRTDDILNNPLNLPEFVPGGKPRESVQGHRDLLQEHVDNLQRRIQQYQDKCGGDPPSIPVRQPKRSPSRSPNNNNNRSLAPLLIPIVVGALVCIFCPECCAAAAPVLAVP